MTGEDRCCDLTWSPRGWLQCRLTAGHDTDPQSLHWIDPAGPAIIRIERDVLVDVVIYHTKTDIKGCRCGWSKLGESWAEHVADVIQERSITLPVSRT